MIRPPHYSPDECQHSTRQLNLEKRPLKCLGCGQVFMTDRCHRFCSVCQRRNRRNHYYLPKRCSLARIPFHRAVDDFRLLVDRDADEGPVFP